MDLLCHFEESLRKHTSFRIGIDRAVMAVSGGVDSMVLLTLCAQAKVTGVVAHCNYHLREDSHLDEQCVRNYAARLAYPIRVQTFQKKEHFQGKGNIEQRARNLRYTFFQSLIEEELARIEGRIFLFTAHHSDDNIETAMLHFLRPTGLLGLSAMSYQYKNILRPLLGCSKVSLYDFAEREGVPFREDTTNQENNFRRNFIRNVLLPQIVSQFPNALNHIQSNIQRYQETYIIYREHIDQVRKQLFRKEKGVWLVAVEQMKALHPLRTWVYTLMEPFLNGAQQVDEVIKLLKAPSGRYLRTQRYELLRHRKNILIMPLVLENKVEHFPILIKALPFSCTVSGRELYFEECLVGNVQEVKKEGRFYLDKRTLSFPLLLRPQRKGDYFYPLGMKKKKKVAYFARDECLTKWERAHLWVLESGTHIIWVMPLRIDERHKVVSTTHHCICISVGKG